MREYLKSALVLFIYHSKFIYFLLLLYRTIFDNPVRILYSHRLVSHDEVMRPLLLRLGYYDVDEFEDRIKYLLRHFRIIPLDEAVSILKSKGSHTFHNAAVLTFDDGYASLFTNVLPILCKYNVPVTVFLTTDAIDNRTLLWYDKLIILVHEAKTKTFQVPALRSKPFDLNSITSKALAISEIAELLKREKPARQDQILEDMQVRLHVQPEVVERYKPYLSLDQIQKMQKSDLISFGSHTVSHPILTKIGSNEVWTEIQASKFFLEEKLNAPILGFSYPGGDYSLHIKRLVQGAGYNYAVATDFKDINDLQDAKQHDLFAMNRYPFTYEPFYRFLLKVNGMLDLIKLARGLSRRSYIWLPHYIKRKFSWPIRKKRKPVHIFLAICDHFEPLWNNVSYEEGLNRIKRFLAGYKEIARKHKDSSKRKPRYSFFYPMEEYHENYFDLLAEFCSEGHGEVEVHLHHDRDSASQLRKRLIQFKRTLKERHGLLSVDKESGQVKYGFIHGNWALDNSREDERFCGVNNELDVLRETGCYADFTMPSLPDETQTSIVNSIYYAVDDPDRPKSHDRGEEVTAGTPMTEDNSFMMIQGPLELNWSHRKGLIFPTLENGALGKNDTISAHRIDLWIKANVHVKGRSDCIFIKLYTHGCQNGNLDSLLNSDFDFLFNHMERRYNDGQNYRVHYVTAREVYNIVKWIENHDAFEQINIEEAREYRLVFQNEQ